MGGLSSREAERLENFAAYLDFGPRLPLELPELTLYSLESISETSRFFRHRDFEMWVDKPPEPMKELYALDASFTVVPGLLGYGYSLRSANLPLHFVRHRDSKFCLSRYDGSQLLRADATFEVKQADLHDSSGSAKEACLMSVNFPGKYMRVDKDGRVILERYCHPARSSFAFRLVAALAGRFQDGLNKPLVIDVSSEQDLTVVAASVVEESVGAGPAAARQQEGTKPLVAASKESRHEEFELVD